MRYRVLAIDLDGTLLDPDEAISERCLTALENAGRRGLGVVIASARWRQVVTEVAGRLTAGGVVLAGPAIACSGAQVFRVGDGTTLMDVRIPEAFAEEFYSICDRVRCVAWSALDDEVLVKMDGVGASLPPGLRQVESLAAASGTAPRMLLVQGGAAVEQVSNLLRPTWDNAIRFMESYSSSGKAILTLTSVGADKGVALGVACTDLGVDPSEVVAIGDAENDIAMFKLAGASFAMGQASDSVKAHATAVTESNRADGVAIAVERLLELGDDAFV